MDTFASVFKYLRERNGITQTELGKYLNLSKSTISMYENGNRTPDYETLEIIADYFNVSLDFLTGRTNNSTFDNIFCEKVDKYIIGDKNTFSTTPHEQNLIMKYRQLNDYSKQTVEYIIERELNRPEQVCESIYDYKVITLYGDCKVSAGLGNIIFDNPPRETVQVPNIDKFKHADYAIYVCGDSMLPQYSDGDTVIVQVVSSVEIGEIGIFEIDGESYIKKLGRGELISLNRKYKPIKINGNTHCMGKVLGKL